MTLWKGSYSKCHICLLYSKFSGHSRFHHTGTEIVWKISCNLSFLFLSPAISLCLYLRWSKCSCYDFSETVAYARHHERENPFPFSEEILVKGEKQKSCMCAIWHWSLRWRYINLKFCGTIKKEEAREKSSSPKIIFDNQADSLLLSYIKSIKEVIMAFKTLYWVLKQVTVLYTMIARKITRKWCALSGYREGERMRARGSVVKRYFEVV